MTCYSILIKAKTFTKCAWLFGKETISGLFEKIFLSLFLWKEAFLIYPLIPKAQNKRNKNGFEPWGQSNNSFYTLGQINNF